MPGGRLVKMGEQAVSTDRLGSVIRHGTANLWYYPYGEEMGTATGQNRTKFGTYTRDVDGTDYAWNRQYWAGRGIYIRHILTHAEYDKGRWRL